MGWLVKGNPRARASRIQLGLPQVGAGIADMVWYRLRQIGQVLSGGGISLCLSIRSLLSPSSIHRLGDAAFELVRLLFLGKR